MDRNEAITSRASIFAVQRGSVLGAGDEDRAIRVEPAMASLASRRAESIGAASERLRNFVAKAAQATLVAAVNTRIEGAGLLARGVRLAVTIVAGAMALSQLGLAIEIVVATFSILFGGVVLALALAFGIGGRDLAKQFLERWVAQGQSRRREAGRGGERQISHL